MKLPVKLDFGAYVPTYAHEGDAGLDLRARTDMKVKPGKVAFVPTGVAVEIPEGYAGMLHLRSGWATKHHVMLANGTGIIDSSFRGYIQIPLASRDMKTVKIKAGERIAQLVIHEVPRFEVEVVPELGATERGSGGFGSSGRW